MNIGELFVSLGVKGSEKTIGAISGVRAGLKETTSMAWETKAALIGVMYATERLFSASGQMGTSLTNFNAVLGGGTKALQQYQYAALAANVSNEEMLGTFQSLSNLSTKIGRGEARPTGLAMLQDKTGLTFGDLDKAQTNPEVLIQKLQEFAQKEKNIGLRNSVLQSFGLSPNVMAALVRNLFTPEKLAAAPVRSPGTIKALDQSHEAWAKVGDKLGRSMDTFTAEHGAQFAKDIDKIITKVFQLAEAFDKLAKKADLFTWIGKVFEGWTLIFTALTAAITSLSEKKLPEVDASGQPVKEKTLGDAQKVDKSQGALDRFLSALFLGASPQGGGLMSAVAEAFETNMLPRLTTGGPFGKKVEPAKPVPVTPTTGKIISVDPNNEERNFRPGGKYYRGPPSQVGGMAGGQMSILGAITPEFLKEMLADKPSPVMPKAAKAAAPTPPPMVVRSGSTQNVEVSQTLNFHHDGTDAKKTGDSVRKAVKDAYRQMPAQLQGS